MTELVTVVNAGDEPETEAEILVRNHLSYVPKVSVIIPVYNVAKYLRQCLDSVVNQTLKEIEIICVDDGSTDESLEILKEYAAKDKRMMVLTQKNLFAGIARNAGLAVASGEYVHFLDSDDWVDLDTYEKLYQLISEKKANVVKFRSYSYDNEAEQIVFRKYTDVARVSAEYFDTFIEAEKQYEVLCHVPDSPWSGIYSRQFLKEHHILFDGLRCGNDVTFFYRCILNSPIYLSTQRHVYYRINNKTSLIGIRAYHFGDLICQRKNVLKVAEKAGDALKELIRKKFAGSLMGWYSGFIGNPALELEVRKNIVVQMKAYAGELHREDLVGNHLKRFDELVSLSVNEVIGRLAECQPKKTKYYLFGIPLLKVCEG